MEYEVVCVQKETLGTFDIVEEPVLGAMLHNDSHNVIVCVDKEVKRIHLAPRITTSDEKPFIEFDWHLGTAFCRRCGEYVELNIVQQVGYCPHCGVLDNGQQCMDQGRTALAFNRFVHEHACNCEGCKHKHGDELCEKCKLVIAEW